MKAPSEREGDHSPSSTTPDGGATAEGSMLTCEKKIPSPKSATVWVRVRPREACDKRRDLRRRQ